MWTCRSAGSQEPKVIGSRSTEVPRSLHTGPVTTPVVVMDEAGHTGENLLDVDQPVYALAGLRMDVSTAEAAVSRALGRTQKNVRELKFSSLRKSNVGRKNILAVLHDIKLTPDDAAIIVVHKPWMVAAKLVDELVEPRM